MSAPRTLTTRSLATRHLGAPSSRALARDRLSRLSKAVWRRAQPSRPVLLLPLTPTTPPATSSAASTARAAQLASRPLLSPVAPIKLPLAATPPLPPPLLSALVAALSHLAILLPSASAWLPRGLPAPLLHTLLTQCSALHLAARSTLDLSEFPTGLVATRAISESLLVSL